MKTQFNFDSTSAAITLNGLLNLCRVWQDIPEGASDRLILLYNAKAEAFKSAYDLVLDIFKNCGLEIIELKTEEVSHD